MLGNVSAWEYTQDFDNTATIDINSFNRFQSMIGGGCSGAFGVACQQFGSEGLSSLNQQEVTQILFDENIGALSILRNDIGSSPGYHNLTRVSSHPSGPI